MGKGTDEIFELTYIAGDNQQEKESCKILWNGAWTGNISATNNCGTVYSIVAYKPGFHGGVCQK